MEGLPRRPDPSPLDRLPGLTGLIVLLVCAYANLFIAKMPDMLLIEIPALIFVLLGSWRPKRRKGGGSRD